MKNLVLLLLLLPFFALAQHTDKKLQRKLETLIKGFNGQAGIYVQTLRKIK